MTLPRWKCHKEVEAAKILSIDVNPLLGEGYRTITLEGVDARHVKPEWMERFKPEIGGYFVRYDDGYSSFSPAAAFEAGYTRIA